MSATEIVCASCEKPSTFHELVRVDTEAYRSIEITPAGEVKRGEIKTEFSSYRDHDVVSKDGVVCDKCREEFDSIEEATNQVTAEYRCDTCDWWGLQHWLHAIERPECEGELAQGPAASTVLAQKALGK